MGPGSRVTFEFGSGIQDLGSEYSLGACVYSVRWWQQQLYLLGLPELGIGIWGLKWLGPRLGPLFLSFY